MRLLSFSHRGRNSFGIVSGDGIIDLTSKLKGIAGSWLEVFQKDAFAIARDIATNEDPDISLDEIRFLPPIIGPEKILCVGVNYANRNEEYKDGSSPAKYPSLFLRLAGSLVGHREPLVRPKVSDQLDYEGEIVLVVGKQGRHISMDSALEHIGGLTICNEGTLRDWVRHAKFNVTQGKNFDRSGSLGPWVMTLDEAPSLSTLALETKVNDEIRQSDTVANMIFPFDYLIHYISTFTTLKPGDLIVTGTPTGAGARFDPPKYLKPGDEIEVQVPGVGALTNSVVDEN